MRHRVALVPALLVAFVAAAGAGCLEPNPAGDPDPLPAWVLDKALFEDGEWWVQRTVTQAPFTAGFTYVGDSDYSDRIHFRVEEHFLIAYRSVDVLEGSDPDVYTEPDSVPSFIWPILRQVDVVAGQQIEAPNKPWYDRTHVVVDWGHEQSGTLRFSLSEVDVAGPAFWVMEPGDKDAPVFSRDYIDFTTHVVVAPSEEAKLTTGGRGACGPGGSLDTAFVDALNCSSMDIAFRTSLRRVPVDNDYEKVSSTSPDMPPGWFDRFFRIGRFHYDEDYGLTQRGNERLMSRFHLWERSSENGQPLPLAERVVKPVVFHLNDAFPAELIPEAQSAIDAWNDVFADTVHDARAAECVKDGGDEDACDESAERPARVIALCAHDPVQKGDDAVCGPVGTRVRLGDLRHNMLYWVTQPSISKPIGFAWWTPDLATGETVAASAKIYGQGIDQSAAFARDAVLMATGRLTPDEIADGSYLDPLADELLAYSRNPFANRFADPGVDDASDLVVDYAGFDAGDGGNDRSPVVRARPVPVRERAAPSLALYRESALSPFIGTDLEALAIDNEALLMEGLMPSNGLSQDVVDRASPLRTSFAQRGADRQDIAVRVAEIGGDLDLPIDPDLNDLVVDFGSETPEIIYEEIRRRFARLVIMHELGHVFGLKHNFAASYDALNYPDAYWVNHRSDCTGPRYSCPLSAEEQSANLEDYAYTSIMDYHPSANAFTKGLGRFDDAAIHALYGGLVEVFTDETLADQPEAARLLKAMHGRDQIAHVPLVLVPDEDDPRGIHVSSTHYSRYPQVLGDLGARRYISSRRLTSTTDDEGRFMVPYLTCADDLVGSMPYCLPYDHGADPYEVTSSLINWFKAYYPLNSFRRGRLVFEPQSYVRNMSSRVFQPLKRWNDWLIHTHSDYDANDASAYSDPDFLEPMQKASELSFSFLTELIATPQPGDYERLQQPDGKPMLMTYKQPISHSEPVPESEIVVSLKFPQGRVYESVAVLDGGLILRNIGSAVDKELALEALLDPSFFDFPGRETWDQQELWTVNFYNEYPDQLVDVLGSIIAGDADRLAPAFDGERIRFRDFTDLTSTVPGERIDPAIGFNLRIRALIYGVSLLYSGYSDRSFLKYAHVGVVGVDDVEVDPAAAVDFEDLSTSTPYRATSRVVDGVELGLGARLLVQANVLQDRANGLGGETAPEQEQAQQALRRQIDLIEITRSVVARSEAAGFTGPIR